MSTHGVEKAPSYVEDHKLDEKADITVIGAEDDRDPELIPTEEELQTLRRVPAGMPLVAILMCLVEFTERASYYGVSGPFNNFINKPLPKGGDGTGAVAKGEAGKNQSAGALGMGSVAASAIVKMFTFLAYVIPIFGAYVADTRWGRFKTICVGTGIGIIAHIILVIPAIPKVIASPNAALGTFIPSVIILAFASGFIKPSVGPLLCDQSPVKEPTIAYRGGQKVIIDPGVTVERYLLIFYMMINLGGIFPIATQYCERIIGFWLAYLLPGLVYLPVPILLWWAHPRLVKIKPQGSVLPDFFRVFGVCLKNGGWVHLGSGGDKFWDRAKPSKMVERGEVTNLSSVGWDDRFVDEIRATLSACAVFMLVPIFFLADGGIGNQLNDMSVAMTLNGVPNDVISNFNSIAIITCAPILTYGFYPLMKRLGINIRPMTRICIGFLFGALGAFIAGVIQTRVYATSPCGKYATTCDDVSPISLWWQVPPIFFPSLGELFVNVTSYELAYTRAPPRMRGLVFSIALFNHAVASAISMALSKVIVDPYLVIPWWVLGAACTVCAFVFPTYFRHIDNFDFKWSADEKEATRVAQQHTATIEDGDRY